MLSVSIVKSEGSQILEVAGHGSLNLLAARKKKATAKMKEHAESEGHILACQTETAAASALHEGSVLQQMLRLEESERLKNRFDNQISSTVYTLYTSLLVTTLFTPLTLGTSLILL